MDELFLLVRQIEQMTEPFSFNLEGEKLRLVKQKKMHERDLLVFLNYLEQKLRDLDYLHFAKSGVNCVKKLIFHAHMFCSKQANKKLALRVLCLSLGGSIGFDEIKKREYRGFLEFIRVNRLDEALVALSMKLMFDEKKGLYFPIYLEKKELWIPVKKIVFKKMSEGYKAFFNDIELFEMYDNYKLSEDYVFSFKGLQKHNVFTSHEIIPFDMQDPKDWDYKHVIEVSTISQRSLRPSMLHNNHAFLVLKDDKGFVHSVGQDFLVYFREPKYLEAFGYKRGQGLITSPDTSVFSSEYRRRLSVVSFVISKKEHAKILEIAKRDKKNLDRMASLLKGNCASYVARLLRLGPKIEVDPFMSGIHIFFKHFAANKLYRPFSKTHHIPKWLKRILFYTPAVYFVQICIGVSTLVMSNRSLNRKRDFNLFDVFFRPYKVGADHPLKLIRELEKKKGNKKAPIAGAREVIYSLCEKVKFNTSFF